MFSRCSSRSARFLGPSLARSVATSVKPAATTFSTSTTLRKPVVETATKLATSTKDTQGKGTSTVKKYSKTLPQSLNGRTTIGNQQLETTTPTEDVASQPVQELDIKEIDWYRSWHGLGARAFSKASQMALQEPLNHKDIEIKPDGILYLPEIKYRRILNQAFGAGAWGLVPRSETIVTSKLVTREYALICEGQLVSVARGEQDYFNEDGIPTATEGCKSNALMRCCKDLGVASELWDPVFIKKFKEEYCQDKFVEHVVTKKKKKIWLRKDRKVEYPYK